MRGRGSRRWRTTVMNHLQTLFRQAEEVAPHDPALAQRYVQMARRIVIRTRIRLPPDLRHRYCHRCEHYLRPGVNSRIRLRTTGRSGSTVITCLSCGYRRKIIWKRPKNGTQKEKSNQVLKRGK
ncbi:MAG: ribonuclease P protein component 4 [Promethearchaeota archaeon]